MPGGKVLLLYSGALNEPGQNGRDQKVLNTIKFMKRNLSSAVGTPLDICDPSTEATAEMDIFDAAVHHFTNCSVTVLILSNHSTNYFEHLKKEALWKRIQGSGSLIIVSVEARLNDRITRHLQTSVILYLLDDQEHSPVNVEDTDWKKFVNTIRKCAMGSSVEAQDAEEVAVHFNSQPSAPPVGAFPPPQYEQAVTNCNQNNQLAQPGGYYGISQTLDDTRSGEQVTEQGNSPSLSTGASQPLNNAVCQNDEQAVIDPSGTRNRRSEGETLVQSESSVQNPPCPVSGDDSMSSSSSADNNHSDGRAPPSLVNLEDNSGFRMTGFRGKYNQFITIINNYNQDGYLTKCLRYGTVFVVGSGAGVYLYKNKSALLNVFGRMLSSPVEKFA